MEESRRLEWILECLVHVIGRVAVNIDEVRKIIGNQAVHIKAYNLCDGTLNLTSVAKKSKLDQGNLSRSINRWVNSGVMFRFYEGKEVHLLHIYPIPGGGTRKRRKKRIRR
jgi:hypothetical protein